MTTINVLIRSLEGNYRLFDQTAVLCTRSGSTTNISRASLLHWHAWQTSKITNCYFTFSFLPWFYFDIRSASEFRCISHWKDPMLQAKWYRWCICVDKTRLSRHNGLAHNSDVRIANSVLTGSFKRFFRTDSLRTELCHKDSLRHT